MKKGSYCVGDVVKIKKDRDYWTKRKGPHEGKQGKVYAVTTKMVRIKIDGSGEQIGKYNPSVVLKQIGAGNHYVMKPKLHSKEWEVVEHLQPK